VTTPIAGVTAKRGGMSWNTFSLKALRSRLQTLACVTADTIRPQSRRTFAACAACAGRLSFNTKRYVQQTFDFVRAASHRGFSARPSSGSKPESYRPGLLPRAGRRLAKRFNTCCQISDLRWTSCRLAFIGALRRRLLASALSGLLRGELSCQGRLRGYLAGRKARLVPVHHIPPRQADPAAIDPGPKSMGPKDTHACSGSALGTQAAASCVVSAGFTVASAGGCRFLRLSGLTRLSPVSSALCPVPRFQIGFCIHGVVWIW